MSFKETRVTWFYIKSTCTVLTFHCPKYWRESSSRTQGRSIRTTCCTGVDWYSSCQCQKINIKRFLKHRICTKLSHNSLNVKMKYIKCNLDIKNPPQNFDIKCKLKRRNSTKLKHYFMNSISKVKIFLFLALFERNVFQKIFFFFFLNKIILIFIIIL